MAASPPPRRAARRTTHVVVLAGQSNMAGRGDPADPAFRAFLRGAGAAAALGRVRAVVGGPAPSWGPAREPLHADKPDRAGVGPGLVAAATIATALGDHARILLVPAAFGGSAIDRWLPGGGSGSGSGSGSGDGEGMGAGGDLATAMRRKLAAALRFVRRQQDAGDVHVSVLWHQGESDCTAAAVDAYPERLAAVVRSLLRDTTTTTTTPAAAAAAAPRRRRGVVVLGQLGAFLTAAAAPRRELADTAPRVQQAIARVGADLGCPVVSAQGLQHQGDYLHFDTASFMELGRRYAARWLEAWRAQARDGGGGGDDGRAAAAAAAAAGPPPSPSPPLRVLLDFRRAADARAFVAVDDRVMGGRSVSSVQQHPRGTHAEFAGRLVLAGGGFASARLRFDHGRPLDLSGCAGLQVEGADDGKAYKLALRTGFRNGQVYYAHPLRLLHPAPTAVARLLFKDFVPTCRGRPVRDAPPLDVRGVVSLSLMLSKSCPGNERLGPGPFALQLVRVCAIPSS